MKETENIIVKKTFDFAADIIDLHISLTEVKHFVLAKQVIRSGTSIGANVRESQRAVSKPDFENKLGIALKEAEETEYWLDLIDFKVMRVNQKLKSDLIEIIKILTAIIVSSKRKN